MSLLLRFVICLAPTVLAILLLLVYRPLDINDNAALTLMMIFIGLGAIISGVCVGHTVYKAMKEPVWAAWLLAIITFGCVGVAYLGIGLAGCCTVGAALG